MHRNPLSVQSTETLLALKQKQTSNWQDMDAISHKAPFPVVLTWISCALYLMNQLWLRMNPDHQTTGALWSNSDLPPGL